MARPVFDEATQELADIRAAPATPALDLRASILLGALAIAEELTELRSQMARGGGQIG